MSIFLRRAGRPGPRPAAGHRRAAGPGPRSTAHPAFAKACDLPRRRAGAGAGRGRRPGRPGTAGRRRSPTGRRCSSARPPATRTASSTRSPRWPPWPPSGACCATSTPASAGWLLPFWERLGEPVPPWDLRVPGVTSLSADIHKYGYAFKGASLVLYRDRDLLRHQYFLLRRLARRALRLGRPRPAPARPRPSPGRGPPSMHLGEEGYLRLAGQVREAPTAFLRGDRGHRRPAQ